MYRLYDGKLWFFKITYIDFKITDGNNDSGSKDINGVDVKYREIKTKGTELVVTFFNLKEGIFD
ncbi:hypothetical protein DFO70_102154 [Cytobacillus firmus]|uniref:Uncharacterized protein n=2 Tax=Cytobacillus TaxID=2675230 RepID=A0A366K229_CYTFI|nr:hypothetical protein DFO70_102154 [Cytobacillus firmus]TDX44742.1 hypothetical protein DFO72_103154 [Cytobacillus oceanisediminis]